MGIGDNIKKYRKQAGLTQKQLAERLGVATGTIQQYELGKREPRFEQLYRIANALNIDEWMLYGKDAWLLINQGATNERNAYATIGYSLGWGYLFTQEERDLIDLFYRLNKVGRATAIERIRELIEIPKYANEED